jgi:hypothetical protein
VVLLLERALVSWSSAIDERSEHEDLCGLGRQSVITYVHGRMSCIAQVWPYSSLSFFLTFESVEYRQWPADPPRER